MREKKSLFPGILISLIVLILITGCREAPKNIKTISGTYAPWKDPFELRVVEQNDSSFSGILKWTENDCWTYAEGEFIGNDSLTFRQLHNIIGHGVVLDDQFPAVIQLKVNGCIRPIRIPAIPTKAKFLKTAILFLNLRMMSWNCMGTKKRYEPSSVISIKKDIL